MGMGEAMDIIKDLASGGLFLERDLNKRGISRNWLRMARFLRHATPRGYGVWSHCTYEPSRYELIQLRFPKLVFWGPSALWLLGVEPREPDAMWIAIDNKSRPPQRLDLTTVVIRTRRLEQDVVTVREKKRFLPLRVHTRERAEADLARADRPQFLAQAIDRAPFTLVPGGHFLSERLLVPMYRQEDWPRLLIEANAERSRREAEKLRRAASRARAP